MTKTVRYIGSTANTQPFEIGTNLRDENMNDSALLEVSDNENLAMYTNPLSSDSSFNGLDSSFEN